MNEQFIIEIEKNKQMIHQGDIFDQCTIGGDDNNYYQSRDLKHNELLIREIGGVYNIIANSDKWVLNGKKIEEKKYYILGTKNKLVCGKYNILIKKIKDNSTGGLELVTEKHEVGDLLGGSTNSTSNIDIYNTSTESSKVTKSKSHHGYLKRLGFFAKFSSNLFNISLFYLCTWFVVPFLSDGPYSKYIEKAQIFILQQIGELGPQYVTNGKISFFSVLLSDVLEMKKLAPIFDELSVKLILGLVCYFIVKGVFAVLLGRPLSFFFLGVSIDGNFALKRIKSFLLEILSPILSPLSFYRLWGLLPFKTIPEILLRILLYRSSSFLGLIGPLYLCFITATILASPLLYQHFATPKNVIIQSKPQAKSGSSPEKVENLIFSNLELRTPMKEVMKVKPLTTPNGNRYKISGGKLKKGVILTSSAKSFFSWDQNLAIGNPLAFLIYPVHALKNINMPIPRGNAVKFQAERMHMVNQILSTSIMNLIGKFFDLGPFLVSAYFMKKEVLEKLTSLDLDLTAYWISNDGAALVIESQKSALISYPLDLKKPQINITSTSTKDLKLFLQYFMRYSGTVKLPTERPGLLEEIFILIDKIDIENFINNINNLVSGDGLEALKKMQNKQKELTNTIKSANKAKEKALKEVDSE